MSLDGRRILVTGAARGLGATLPAHLHEVGADLILADILKGEGREVAKPLGARFHPVDLRDPGSITVACGGGTSLVIRRLVPEGRRLMTAGEFLRGSTLREGSRLG